MVQEVSYQKCRQILFLFDEVDWIEQFGLYHDSCIGHDAQKPGKLTYRGGTGPPKNHSQPFESES